jgi:hypothetical protein
VVTAALVLGLSGCAQRDGHDYAVQACHYVQSSIAAYQQARADPGSPAAPRLRAKALADLRTAMPISALAAADDTQWQALAATLGESSRVDEGDLIHALQAQCATATSPTAVGE